MVDLNNQIGIITTGVAARSNSRGVAKEWIEEIVYSPDSSILAVGSHDNRIYLYQTS